MKDEHRYTELTKADTLNRLTYLVQLHNDRANDESVPSHRRGDPVNITVCTSGDLDSVVLSMTKAKELIKKTWARMTSEAPRVLERGNFVSAIPTMELHLTTTVHYGCTPASTRPQAMNCEPSGMPSKQPDKNNSLNYTQKERNKHEHQRICRPMPRLWGRHMPEQS